MAWVKELDDVSPATMCMDTLAMDSMDMHPEAIRIVEAPTVLTGAQSEDGSNADSGAGGREQQDKGDVCEIVDPVGTRAQEFDSSEAEETRSDDHEGLMTDPGTPDTYGAPGNPGTFQEVFPEDVHELDKDMNIDLVENELEEEIGYDDEVLMNDRETPETPGTFQDESAQGVDGLDDTNDMNLDETKSDLEDQSGFDNDRDVDVAEHDPEDLDEGEKSHDGQFIVASFPIIRVKRIIKLDKDVRLVSRDAVALVAQATALFVQSLSSASFTAMLQTKRKTVRGPDVAFAAMSTRQFRECLGNDLATLLKEFNEGTMIGDDELVGKEHATAGEPFRKKLQLQKSAMKHQLTSGSRPISNFFNHKFEGITNCMETEASDNGTPTNTCNSETGDDA